MDTIFGLPTHPLVVHAVVVLLPLAAIGVLLLAVVPRWRTTFGPLVLIVTAGATALVPLATESGEGLEKSVEESDVLERHTQLGDTALFFALPLLVAAVALWWLGRQATRDVQVSQGLGATVAVLSVVVALAAGVQIARIGHSGAESAWGDVGVEGSQAAGG